MKDYTRHPLLTRQIATEDTDRRPKRILLTVITAVVLIATIGVQLVWFVSDFEQAPRQLTTASPAQSETAAPRATEQPSSETVAIDESTYPPGGPGSSLPGNRDYPNDPDLTNKTVSNPGVSSGHGGSLKATLEALRLDGVTVEQINEDDGRFTIVGFADDNVRIAAYMRLLNKAAGKPELNIVQKGQRQEKSVSEFSISMKM